ncbi:hypothetical protein ABPG72_008981 [Tetrahymena utriculariae]
MVQNPQQQYIQPGMGNMFNGAFDNLLPMDTYPNSDINQHEHIKKLKDKFADLREEINQMGKDPEIFRSHQLPLARVKKIMKSDEDVRMISAEAPVLFAKACEIFIIELTHRAWLFTEEGKRRTLQKNDIAACIYNTEIFDFLIDILPKEDPKSTNQIKKPSQEAFPSMNPIGAGNFMKDHNLMNSMNMNQNQMLSNQFMNNLSQGIPPSHQQNPYAGQQMQQQQMPQAPYVPQQHFGQQFGQYPFSNQQMQPMNQGIGMMDNMYNPGVKEEPKKYYDQQNE